MSIARVIGSLGKTLLAAALVMFSLAQPHAGFMLIFLAIPLLPWTAYSVYIMVAKPLKRCVQAQKLAIWMLVCCSVIGIHYARHLAAKTRAQDVVSAIEAYSSIHGYFPQTIDAVGMTEKELRVKLSYAAYGLHEGKPYFFYASTYVPFEQEAYNFETKKWWHVYD
jgi:hypothetical protein